LEPALAIGLMSGTSLDGVDAALVDFSGPHPAVRATHFAPFPQSLREEMLSLQSCGTNEIERGAMAANELARAYAAGVAAVLHSSGTPAGDVLAIGAHGQTVRHRPELGFTVQLNNPALLAELTGITVVADFRSRDVAAGGQGAPLAPAFHRAFFSSLGKCRAVVNVGGIANVTLLGADGDVGGFDTGPGNVLMDLWCQRNNGQPFDDSGAWARTGKVDSVLLGVMLADAYFARPAPKSTGRDLFNAQWLAEQLAQLKPVESLPPQDVQATLLELTARSIVDCVTDKAIDAMFICGGGARNDYLMERLHTLLGGKPVQPTSTIGVPPDWVEAVAFAWFAMQTLEGTPSNLPTVTGARGSRMLGAIYPA
jgi:anhydro-N-acetylmuramic acid kinase